MIAGFDKNGDNICYYLNIEGRVLAAHTDSVNIDLSKYNFVEVRNTGNTKFMIDGSRSFFPGDVFSLGSSNDINKVHFRHSFQKTDCTIEAEGTCCDGPRIEVYAVSTSICGYEMCPRIQN